MDFILGHLAGTMQLQTLTNVVHTVLHTPVECLPFQLEEVRGPPVNPKPPS